MTTSTPTRARSMSPKRMTPAITSLSTVCRSWEKRLLTRPMGVASNQPERREGGRKGEISKCLRKRSQAVPDLPPSLPPSPLPYRWVRVEHVSRGTCGGSSRPPLLLLLVVWRETMNLNDNVHVLPPFLPSSLFAHSLTHPLTPSLPTFHEPRPQSQCQHGPDARKD